ncbi:MAG: metallophosphoesterase [Acetobacteraceae bacterium]|nr:metallophosphoesterase [Acetobacteraceae bacterium]
MSDTHGDRALAQRALEAMGPVDLVVHAGDGYADAQALRAPAGTRVVAVAGNCDRGVPGALEEVIEVEGVRILVAHGHTYGVHRGLGLLLRRAAEVQAHVVLFGHTHLAGSRRLKGVLALNPGSVRFNPLGSSFAVLHLEGGRARPEIRRL